jgi:hypothetical protein
MASASAPATKSTVPAVRSCAFSQARASSLSGSALIAQGCMKCASVIRRTDCAVAMAPQARGAKRVGRGAPAEGTRQIVRALGRPGSGTTRADVSARRPASSDAMACCSPGVVAHSRS